jgi:putative heme-binding domain-containing protein
LRLLWISLAALTLYAQRPSRVVDPARLPERNPHTSAADVAEGKRLFMGRCALCHGQAGEGGRGPSLHTARPDRVLFTIVRLGIPNTEMPPSFAQTDSEIWRIVAFVQQLSTRGAAPEVVPGDPEIGKKVYAAQSCHVCHMIDGEGSDLGPDLSRAGARTVAFLKESVRNPDVDVSVNYHAVVVTTAVGATVRGVFLGEDEYSIQLRDMRGNPRSFLKSDLKDYRHESGSLMPAFTMPATDLDNIVAYLKSKR